MLIIKLKSLPVWFFFSAPTARKKHLSIAVEDTQFCLEELTEGEYQLKRTHAYFYQISVSFVALWFSTTCPML